MQTMYYIALRSLPRRNPRLRNRDEQSQSTQRRPMWKPEQRNPVRKPRHI